MADKTAPPAGATDVPIDPLRQRLLDAAATVFAAKGYSGTKVVDIVREAGLSSGAMYGRFDSKNDLLMEAVVAATMRSASGLAADRRVGDLIADFASHHFDPLSDGEAIQLEAYVTARREPEVAEAIKASRRLQRKELQPIVDRAVGDDLLGTDSDVDSMLFFLDTMRLGLMVQRAAGVRPPHARRWTGFVRRLMPALAEVARRPS